jgi:hypothetical protein
MAKVKAKPKGIKFWEERAKLSEAALAEATAEIVELKTANCALAGEPPVRLENIIPGDSVLGPVLADIPRCYALVQAKTQGGIIAWHLIKFRLDAGRVTWAEKSVENMRGVLLQAIEDDILRDA